MGYPAAAIQDSWSLGATLLQLICHRGAYRSVIDDFKACLSQAICLAHLAGNLPDGAPPHMVQRPNPFQRDFTAEPPYYLLLDPDQADRGYIRPAEGGLEIYLGPDWEQQADSKELGLLLQLLLVFDPAHRGSAGAILGMEWTYLTDPRFVPVVPSERELEALSR